MQRPDVVMPPGPSAQSLAERTLVFPIHGGRQAVCINPPEGYGPSAEVATVWPCASSWGPDAELIVLALRCAQLDELVGPLSGQGFFDASGTSGMLAVVASRYGAEHAWVLCPEDEPGHDPTIEPWLPRHYPQCRTTLEPGRASSCGAAVYNFYRYPEPECLAAVGHALPPGARMVVVGALPAHLSTIDRAARSVGMEVVTSAMPWVDEMQLVTLIKRDGMVSGRASGAAPAFELPRGPEARYARWAHFAASLRVAPNWRVDSRPRPAVPNEHAIAIAPSLSYGSGGNDVTQMVLQSIGGVPEATWARDPAVLDLGCGTGILAIACARRGATRITAMDICPRARAEASRNARINGVDVRVTDQVPPGQRFDVIVANLYGSVWPEYLPRLSSMLELGGIVLCGGIPSKRHAAFEASLVEAGLELVDVHRTLGDQDVGWPCAVARRPR